VLLHSGLDAAAAASIMRFLKELAVAANIAIVCTIHQPSSAVYNGFDRVMLLSGGKVAFLGAAADALPHFTDAARGVIENQHSTVVESQSSFSFARLC